MTDVSRRTFLGISALSVASLMTSRGWSLPSSAQNGESPLYRSFLDPDRKFSIRPFWFWNGRLDATELRRQMKEMIDHGVYGAYAHNRDGLETPYLSEEWWKVLGEALDAAEELGFSLCMVDEFEWPSGEARDYWLPGPQKSRVVQANPDHHMKRLRPVEHRVHGPQTIKLPVDPHTAHLVSGKVVGEKRLDPSSLQLLAMQANSQELSWNVPEGDWIIFEYILEDTIGPDHGSVDLMSREAVAAFIGIYYEELHKRHGKHFGKALPVTFADHEGTYGGRLPWTPRLLETFQASIGYELAPMLPALTYDIGPRTEKIRCDLLDTISDLYSRNFWQQVTDWCEKHKLEHSGHVWEESLFFGPAYQGDFFRVLRSMSHPGCDTLLEWGRQSVWLKENASVADFERKHVICENQGVQGETSYLSPERMRRVSNALGAWNIGEFIPHAFDYNLAKTNYPPDWFRSQPYLHWFKDYADQMRRVSFMNRDSHEIADIVVLYPQVSIWGQAAPAFTSDRFDYILRDDNWNADARQTNDRYTELKLLLSQERLAYQVADDHYLGTGRVEGARFVIADSHFKVMLVPPMSTIRRTTAKRICEFIDAGGIVFALAQLPTISVEDGRDDAALRDLLHSRFVTVNADRLPGTHTAGRAYLVQAHESDLIRLLHEQVRPDAIVLEGPADNLFTMRKQKDGVEFFWFVNDSPTSRVNLLELPAHGRPERWDAQSGLKAPLFYQSTADGTRIRLKLEAWDAVYVVFDPDGPLQAVELSSTNLDDFHIVKATPGSVSVHVASVLQASGGMVELSSNGKHFRGLLSPTAPARQIEGEWQVTIEAPSIDAPYAFVVEDPDNLGTAAAWFALAPEDLHWQELWLSPMRYALHAWNVIGPFPNPHDLGLEQAFAPETEIDLSKSYSGEHELMLKWLEVDSTRYKVRSDSGIGEIGTVDLDGGPAGNRSHIVDYGSALGISPLDGTFYLQTNVYVAQGGPYRLLLGTGSPRAVFVNGKQVYSRWLRPLYNVLDDAFADKIEVHMQSGWNSLLVKLLHNPANEVGGSLFCRIESAQSKVVEGLVCSTRTYQQESQQPVQGYRWLRFEVPPLVSAMNIPPLRYSFVAYVDGKQVRAERDIPLLPTTRQLMIRVDAREILDTPFSYQTRRGPLEAGTWMRPGLENFSGMMTYEKEVVLSEDLLKEELLLDCGIVGVVAEAWINDEYVGSRAWQPFAFKLSPHARRGVNRLKVRIANTEGNARAVGLSRDNLKRIDTSGWHGPVRLVPFVDREMTLTPA